MKKQRQSHNSLRSIATVGTYVPRRCGIATFTSDTVEALTAAAPHVSTWAVAINDRPEGYRYPQSVWFEINQHRLGEYRLAADFLNMSNADVCTLQHEFGIFGGESGQHILEMIRRLRMPVVTTLHTVLREPSKHQRRVMDQLVEASDRVVIMADRAYGFLRDIYDVPEEKIALVHHGIPDVPFVDPNYYKDHFGVEGKHVILTFGLLSPGKGIEYMIDALPAIVAKHPDTVYFVLGATHPGVVAESGEEYRLGLKRRAQELGVQQNVEFINKFVELDELIEYLGAADIYVTPYRNEAQIVSGTLAYALGTGKATVSTPYWYAQEMLADQRGMLVDFDSPQSLSEAIIYLLDNETNRHAMRKRAYQFTRQMRWSEIANQYLDLYETVRTERNRHPRPSTPTPAVYQKDVELTEVKLDHLQVLGDDTGIFKHAKSTVPQRGHGYATTDNARSLIAVLLAQDHLHDPAGTNLDVMINRFLSFLEDAFNEDTGRFRNQLGFDRKWRDRTGPEEAHGLAIWALGEAVARSHIRGHLALAVNLFQQALPACEKVESLHGLAYNLIGIHAYLRRFSGDSNARRIREQLAGLLFEKFQFGDDDWPWPSDTLTYANARLPHALLLSGRWMFNNEMIQTALRSLAWLNDVQTGSDGQFAPVGTEGWFPRGKEKARFDQKPLEAAATIDACLEAFRVTEDQGWVESANKCFNWFLGENDLRLPLYDQTTGGCSDGLMAEGLNQNQGAEATLSWLLSLLSLYEHNLDVRTGTASISTAPDGDGKPAGSTSAVGKG